MLVIGDTGCGKSTLLSALIKGSESMELKTIKEEYEVKTKNGKLTKTKTTHVIDYKRDVADPAFKIGHS